jgi:hypothetical protein
MKLVDQWSALERRLPVGWESVTLRLRPEQASDTGEAARLLGSMSPGLVGDELSLTVSRLGGSTGANAARRHFGVLDDARVWCELRQEGDLVESAAATPGEEPGSVAPSGSVRDDWDAVLVTLPSDWADLLCRLEIDSSDELPRTALLCAPLNPTKVEGELAFTFRCGRQAGYGVSPAMARRCFERLDEEGLPGRVEVLRLLSETDNVSTQGATWVVGGKTL